MSGKRVGHRQSESGRLPRRGASKGKQEQPQGRGDKRSGAARPERDEEE